MKIPDSEFSVEGNLDPVEEKIDELAMELFILMEVSFDSIEEAKDAKQELMDRIRGDVNVFCTKLKRYRMFGTPIDE